MVIPINLSISSGVTSSREPSCREYVCQSKMRIRAYLFVFLHSLYHLGSKKQKKKKFCSLENRRMSLCSTASAQCIWQYTLVVRCWDPKRKNETAVKYEAHFCINAWSHKRESPVSICWRPRHLSWSIFIGTSKIWWSHIVTWAITTAWVINFAT